mgnify:CR=1 FL=1
MNVLKPIERQIQFLPYSRIYEVLEVGKERYWLIQSVILYMDKSYKYGTQNSVGMKDGLNNHQSGNGGFGTHTSSRTTTEPCV